MSRIKGLVDQFKAASPKIAQQVEDAHALKLRQAVGRAGQVTPSAIQQTAAHMPQQVDRSEQASRLGGLAVEETRQQAAQDVRQASLAADERLYDMEQTFGANERKALNQIKEYKDRSIRDRAGKQYATSSNLLDAKLSMAKSDDDFLNIKQATQNAHNKKMAFLKQQQDILQKQISIENEKSRAERSLDKAQELNRLRRFFAEEEAKEAAEQSKRTAKINMMSSAFGAIGAAIGTIGGPAGTVAGGAIGAFVGKKAGESMYG